MVHTALQQTQTVKKKAGFSFKLHTFSGKPFFQATYWQVSENCLLIQFQLFMLEVLKNTSTRIIQPILYW